MRADVVYPLSLLAARRPRYPTLGFLLLVHLLAVSATAQTTAGPPPPSQDREFQKLDVLATALRNRNVRDYTITTPSGIDQGTYVEIGGIQQWITIRGEDRRNPGLLFVHGGPGDATNPWSYAVFRPWLKAFTVVQWDQRGAGRTLGINGKPPGGTLTIARMTEDGLEVAEYVRKTLQKDKVILVGHSWGSILGVLMVKARPDLFYAYVGTGQVVDSARNYALAYDELVKKAEALRDHRAIMELKDVGPPPYSDGRGYAVQRKWSNLFQGADVFLASMIGLAMSAPGNKLKDLNDWVDGQDVSGQALVPQMNALDAKTVGGDFAVPVFVFQGTEDFTTPTRLAREFVSSITAPRKDFVPIDGGGHFAVFMKSDVFLKELVRRVRAFATVP